MQGFEHGRGVPIHMSVTEVASLPGPVSSDCLLTAAIQTKPKEHICQGIEDAFFYCPPNSWIEAHNCSWLAKWKVLVFLLGSDISKCCKNFYYLNGVLENASHFPSLSPQRLWNFFLYHRCMVYWLHFIQTVTWKAKILIRFVNIKR